MNEVVNRPVDVPSFVEELEPTKYWGIWFTGSKEGPRWTRNDLLNLVQVYAFNPSSYVATLIYAGLDAEIRDLNIHEGLSYAREKALKGIALYHEGGDWEVIPC